MSKNIDEDEWAEFGFVPLGLLNPETETESHAWVRVSVHKNSGQFRQEPISDEELELAEDRYVGFLVEHGVISEQQRDEVLG